MPQGTLGHGDPQGTRVLPRGTPGDLGVPWGTPGYPGESNGIGTDHLSGKPAREIRYPWGTGFPWGSPGYPKGRPRGMPWGAPGAPEVPWGHGIGTDQLCWVSQHAKSGTPGYFELLGLVLVAFVG